MAKAVDQLLRQLPHADPTLRQPRPARPAGAATPPRPQPVVARPALTAQQVAGVWARLAAAGLFGVAVTQWPYPTGCGWWLVLYGVVVGCVLVAAGWAATTAWRHRLAIAHGCALVVAFWGIVLAAEQVLPRIGYAAETMTWRCEGPGPAGRR